MKPFVIVALWAAVGMDLGTWAETLAGIPAVIGIVAGVAIGIVLAVEVRRRIIAGAARRPPVAETSSADSAPALERAA